MESEHFVGKVSVRALIERGDTIFICRGIGDGVWQLPGGRMDVGEEPAQTLARELKEELGVVPADARLLYTQTFVHNKDKVPQLLLVYVCSIGEQAMTIDPAETEEGRFVTLAEAASLAMFDDCRNAVDEYRRIKISFEK